MRLSATRWARRCLLAWPILRWSKSSSIPTAASFSIGSAQGEATRDDASYEARERVIRLVADHMGLSITAQTPRLSGVLPTGVERFQGLAPPIVAAPTFAIRKRPAVIWTLEDYVREGPWAPRMQISCGRLRPTGSIY